MITRARCGAADRGEVWGVKSFDLGQHHSHLRPDGSTFPPVTPDPPPPPGYVDPLATLDVAFDVDEAGASPLVDGSAGSEPSQGGPSSQASGG